MRPTDSPKTVSKWRRLVQPISERKNDMAACTLELAQASTKILNVRLDLVSLTTVVELSGRSETPEKAPFSCGQFSGE